MALTGAAALLLLASCGQVQAPGGAGDGDGARSAPPPGSPAVTSAPPEAADVIDPDAELVGRPMLLQAGPDVPIVACLGGVQTSYPPRCGGPEIKGEFSWDQIGSEVAGGVTWSVDAAWVVGHYDADDGAAGSFTLTRPVSADPPAGFTPEEPAGLDFPQLCEDPTADLERTDQDARTQAPDGADEEQALLSMLHDGGLEGYVTAYVSGGGETFNVIVTGDAEVARQSVREVYGGPLCVEQRDLPTQEDVLAAQQALHDPALGLALLSSGAGGVSGLLEVEVLLADRATVDAIHEAVAEWLTPDQVVISSALQPLDEDA